MTILIPLVGISQDRLRKNGTLSTKNIRKIFLFGGFLLEGFILLCTVHATTAVRIQKINFRIKRFKK